VFTNHLEDEPAKCLFIPDDVSIVAIFHKQ
jgi:hypothetical protein